jgi:hypothetical protein
MFETNRTPTKSFYHQIWGECPLISIHNNCWPMNVAGKPKPVKLYLKGSMVYPLSQEELCQYSSCMNHLHYQTYGQNKLPRVSYFKVTPLERRYLSCTQQGARENSDRVEWSRSWESGERESFDFHWWTVKDLCKTLTRKMNLSILRHSGDRTRNQFLALHVLKVETEISISLQTAIYNQVMGKSNNNFPLLSSPFRGHKDVDKKVEELLRMSKTDKRRK